MQVVIDEGLKRQFKSACVLDGTNMSEVVSGLIDGWLQQRERTQDNKTEDNKTQDKR